MLADGIIRDERAHGYGWDEFTCSHCGRRHWGVDHSLCARAPGLPNQGVWTCRFRGEVRSWDQDIEFDGILSSSLGRSFGSAESIFSSRPARSRGCRVECLSRTADTLAVRLAVTFPGRALYEAFRSQALFHGILGRGDEPARSPHLDDSNKGGLLIEDGEVGQAATARHHRRSHQCRWSIRCPSQTT